MTNSPVRLREIASQKLVDAELHDAITQQHLEDWRLQWLPALAAIRQRLATKSIKAEEWPQSSHWNWQAKLANLQKLLSSQSLSVVRDNITQGMMCIDTAGKRAQLKGQENQHLVYIDYLETAPWNWSGPHYDPPRYGLVGSVLVHAAIQISLAEGFKGRVGLHSLPQSVAFYERRGFVNLGGDPAVNKGKTPYFEMTPELAQKFLNPSARSKT